jgi:hypothetical protein
MARTGWRGNESEAIPEGVPTDTLEDFQPIHDLAPDTTEPTDPAPADPAPEPAPAETAPASEPAPDGEAIFSRAKPSPFHADVEAIRDTKETRRARVEPATDENVRKVQNAVRKAGRELHVSLNVKYADGYVYFRVKDAVKAA